MNFKSKIVEYLKDKNDDETVDMLDVFKYSGNDSLQLTHYGYRNLKDSYEFLEIEFLFTYNIKTFSTLVRAINGLFYYTIDKHDGTIKIETTDAKFVNRIKLCRYDFNWMIKKYHTDVDKLNKH